jgi:peptidoglycan lytic transglycosylase
MRWTVILLAALVLVALTADARAQQPAVAVATPSPTNHPRLPRDLTQLWMVPAQRPTALTPAQRDFKLAVKLEVDGTFTRALPMLQQPALKQGPLASYAEYYLGLAQLRLNRPEEACRTFQAMQARAAAAYIGEAAALREAECRESLGDRAAALAIYERLAATNTAPPDDLLLRLGRAAKFSGNSEKAKQAFARLYYEFPLSDVAQSAAAELDLGSDSPGSSRYTLRLARAERLFNAKRYTQARTEFEALRPPVPGADRELIDLRVAECDYYLKRPRIAKAALRPYLGSATRPAEARYFYALSLRALNEIDDYLKTIRQVADDYPTDPWADDALDDLAYYYVVTDRDDLADTVFRDLYARFPTGHNAERAAWKIGWSSYRKGNFGDTTRVFDRAAVDFPRSDYRPMWLYWSGRAYAALNDAAPSIARYSLAVTDYANTYHGRLALKRLAEQGVVVPERRLIVDVTAPAAGNGSPGEPPPRMTLPANASVIRALLELDLYDQAVDELKYAQRAWGNSSPIDATLAWILWQQGRAAKGTEQFSYYRGAINAMKRAYPHYLASDGENLPKEILQLIFPIAYWDAIRKYAEQFNVDPFLSAALIAQESTFVPDIKSYANAVGLTQLRPATARQYARTLNLVYTPRMLTDPESNIRIGMAYLAAKIREFGQVHLALASYNAGERPVHRWVAERPDLPLDEFIDDIPYPQTNNYVKKLLSTAEDYRHLYAPDGRPESVVADRSAAAASTSATASAAPLAPAKPAVSSGTKPKATAAAPAAKKPVTKAKKPRKAA